MRSIVWQQSSYVFLRMRSLVLRIFIFQNAHTCIPKAGVCVLTEQEKRLHRCCFTGHRPEKLNSTEEEIKKALLVEVNNAIHDEYITFISGMARGVDIWAAELVLELRNSGAPIHLICAMPFNDFEQRWPVAWQQRYKTILQSADLVRFIAKEYHISTYQRRNEWMIDHSNRVIAVYNGSSGGTRNALEYAQKKEIETRLAI